MYLLREDLFQVRVIESLEPSPTENALTYGRLVGHFSEKREKSYQSCPNKFVTFDLPLAEAIDFGQVFVILKRTLQQTELPQIKIYGKRDEGNLFFTFLTVYDIHFRFSRPDGGKSTV